MEIVISEQKQHWSMFKQSKNFQNLNSFYEKWKSLVITENEKVWTPISIYEKPSSVLKIYENFWTIMKNGHF